MHPTDKAARIAGALYLSLAVTAPFSLIYVPGKLIVHGNAAATASNILAHEMLFRLSIVGDLVGNVIFMLVAIALYRLLSGVNKTWASLMVALVLVSVAIGFLSELNNVAALTLFRGADYLAVFDQPQLAALGMFKLGLSSQGNHLNMLLWGLWLFPFGVLVIWSRFLPRILGVFLIANCFAYVAISLTALLLPVYPSTVSKVALPFMALGELSIVLWLLIKGAKVPPVAVGVA